MTAKTYTLGGMIAAVVLLASASTAQAQFIVGPSYGGTYITPGGSVINKRIAYNPYTGGSVINKQIINPGYQFGTFGSPTFSRGFGSPVFSQSFGSPVFNNGFNNGFNRGYNNVYRGYNNGFNRGFNNGFNNNIRYGRPGVGVNIGFIIR